MARYSQNIESKAEESILNIYFSWKSYFSVYRCTLQYRLGTVVYCGSTEAAFMARQIVTLLVQGLNFQYNETGFIPRSDLSKKSLPVLNFKDGD